MNKTTLSIILTLIVFVTSCSTRINKTPKLINIKWIYTGYQNDNLIYEKNWKFKHNKHGIKFKKDSTIKKKIRFMNCVPNFWERTNVRRSGKWNMTTDSIITIQYRRYDSIKIDTFKIVDLTIDKMILTRKLEK